MAKSKTGKHTGQTVKPKSKESVNYELYIDKYFWLVIPLLAIIYYFTSNISVGFYQDDEIAQYLNAIKFKIDAFSILGNNPKPGWKIFIVLPALIDYKAVLIFNSLIAALTVFFTFRLMKEYGLKYAYFGSLMLAIQPLFFDLSFRVYSEIFTALLLTLFLILNKKEKYIHASLLIGYALTVRQELIIFAFVYFIYLIWNYKKYLPALLIGVFPIIYSVLGYMKTGDMFFVLTEMKSTASLEYNTQGIFHYFIVYIFIVGPITLLLFSNGFLGFFANTNNYKEYFKKYFIFYILFLTVFAVQMYTMMGNGPNPGNWRYLLHLAPVAAFFALVGFNNLADEKYKKLFYYISGGLFFITFAFLSRDSDGFKLLDTYNFTKAVFLMIAGAAILIISKKNTTDYLNKLSAALLIISIIYLSADFKPKQLSVENQTVKSTAEYLSTLNYSGNVYTNHAVLQFFMKDYKNNPAKFLPLNSQNMSDVPKGSILIWESHYGYRPEFKNDIKVEDLQNNPDYKFINQIVSVDKRFASFIFEKVK